MTQKPLVFDRESAIQWVKDNRSDTHDLHFLSFDPNLRDMPESERISPDPSLNCLLTGVTLTGVLHGDDGAVSEITNPVMGYKSRDAIGKTTPNPKPIRHDFLLKTGVDIPQICSAPNAVPGCRALLVTSGIEVFVISDSMNTSQEKLPLIEVQFPTPTPEDGIKTKWVRPSQVIVFDQQSQHYSPEPQEQEPTMKIVRAINAMIENKKDISGIFKLGNEIYFSYKGKYMWSIVRFSQDKNSDEYMQFYLSLYTIVLTEPPKEMGSKVMMFRSADTPHREATESYSELFQILDVTLLGVENVLDDIIAGN